MISDIIAWAVISVGVVGGLYASHRLLLWLEREEWICYLNRKPSGGGSGTALLELQKYLEPQVEHVQHLHEKRKKEQENGEDERPR